VRRDNLNPGERGRIVAVEYKVVELGLVSDEEIETALNEWTAKGWTFDSMQFAMRDSSKRPAMAFITFIRSEESGLE
jgi:hypothetical protein